MKMSAVSMMVLPLMPAAGNAWAFRVPADSPEELLRGQIKMLTDTESAQRWALIILAILLFLSLVVNVMLLLALWKAQKQAADTMEAVRNVNAIKETAIKLISSSKRTGQQLIEELANEDLDDDEIKIVRSGL